MGFIILAVVTLIILLIIAFAMDASIAMLLVLGWAVVMIGIAMIPEFIIFERAGVKIEEKEITALSDNTNTEGSIFLGSGSISGVDYYYYMEDGDKGFSMDKVLVASSHIKEVEDEQYKLETYKLEMTSVFAKWFYDKIIEDKHEYIFHVPEGSVTRDFKVDME